ncbi:MAG: precorrin-3B C(17)-methyltransferase, partial [Desulfobacterales bacterium]
MRSRGNTGSKERNATSSQTFNKKRNGRPGTNRLFVVGIGPGSLDHLSKRAVDVLSTVEVVVGYSTYVDLIHPLVDGKEIIRTGMTREVERVEAAIEHALDGKLCAIVSSGDPGIYAMAGLVFETCKIKDISVASRGSNHATPGDPEALIVEVVPGIPALCAGASLLGAPLSHDFAAISLSDLLTPWELIEQRIEAAARADFVIVLYNPKSKKRTWQLKKAQKILLKYRDKRTPVGIVARAMREQQDVHVVSLENLHTAVVDMQTTVFIGSSASSRYRE